MSRPYKRNNYSNNRVQNRVQNSISSVFSHFYTNDGKPCQLHVDDKEVYQTSKRYPGFLEEYPNIKSGANILSLADREFPCNVLVIQANGYFHQAEIKLGRKLFLQESKFVKYVTEHGCSNEEITSFSTLHHAYHCSRAANYVWKDGHALPTDRVDLRYQTFLDTTCKLAVEIASLPDNDEEPKFRLVQFKPLKTEIYPLSEVAMDGGKPMQDGGKPMQDGGKPMLCIMTAPAVDSYFSKYIATNTFIAKIEELCIQYTTGAKRNMNYVFKACKVFESRLGYASIIGHLLTTKRIEQVERYIFFDLVNWYDSRVDYLTKFLSPAVIRDVKLRYYAVKYFRGVEDGGVEDEPEDNQAEYDPFSKLCSSFGEKGSFVSRVDEILARPTEILRVPSGLPTVETWVIGKSNPRLEALSHIAHTFDDKGVELVDVKEQNAYETLRLMREAYDHRHEFDSVVEGEPGTKLEEFINELPSLDDAIETARTRDTYAWIGARLLRAAKGYDSKYDYPVRFFLTIDTRLPLSDMSIEEAIATHMAGSPAANKHQLGAYHRPTAAAWRKVLPEFDFASLDPFKLFKSLMILTSIQSGHNLYDAVKLPGCTIFSQALLPIVQTYNTFVTLLAGKDVDAAVFKAARSVMSNGTENVMAYAFVTCIVEHYSSPDTGFIARLDQAKIAVQEKGYVDFGIGSKVEPFLAIGFSSRDSSSSEQPMMTPEEFIEKI